VILDQFGNMTRFAWADDRSGSFATEIACPRRVRFYPDGGLNDETRARLVAACWRFAAVSYVTSYPPETP